MTELIREQLLAALQDDWGSYVERFQNLSPEEQTAFLHKQGYSRLADLLAHLVAWWREGKRAVESMLKDPDFVDHDYDVDAFNAQAVAAVRALDEWVVIASFESMRRQMVQLITGLPDSAFGDKRIVDRLRMEAIGHLGEHALPAGKD